MYKHHKVIAVRKVIWDRLWHIVYKTSKGETWDRVPESEALEAAKTI